MQTKDFPIVGTKGEGLTERFDLSDLVERRRYFEAKVGKEIDKLKEYMDENTFVAYMLGKKNAGKGTYSKLLTEIFGSERLGHVSVGDIVRQMTLDCADENKRKELIASLKKSYRGFISLEEAIKSLENRDVSFLLPTEFILAAVKNEIDKMPKKSLMIDGFPRELDQVSYSLYFRDLINYRDDPDFFVLFNVPESVIDERIKYRRVCPICQTPRNLKLMTTKKVGFDKEKKEFYLICDNPECKEMRMVGKENDELGIEPLRKRLELDQKLIDVAYELHGVQKVLLRNSIPVSEAGKFDNYELTPEFVYEWKEDEQKVVVTEKPWTIKDDEGVESNSLMASAVVVSMIKQMVEVLGL